LAEHHAPLIAMIAASLVLAFALGLLAHRLRISPLVGYLLAGIAVGPFTPGFVGDQYLANQLAEIGVILLMFGVGLHFSLKDLMAVRAIALPGAVAQIAVATLLGMGLAWWFDWNMGAGLVFGLALSVASTVVLTKTLQERRILETERGRIAVGWLIVEDLAMVLTLVLLPAVAGALGGASAAVSWGGLAVALALTLAKVAAFVAIMLVAGRRVVPWILHYAAHTGSRELFRLAVYALALGVAYGAATLFGASFALGAFFAGMVLAESPLSQRATQEALPLRDAFAVLFFVSVGMLFDPRVLVEAPWAVLATVVIIVLGKSVAALLIVRAFGHPWATSLTIAASLAQIGEFSFILAALGVTMGLLPEAGRDLILAGAMLSILLNPLFFAAVERPRARAEHPATAAARPGVAPPPAAAAAPPITALTDHDVLVGYGRVGARLGAGLRAAGRPLVVFAERTEDVDTARRGGAEVVDGNAADPKVLRAANLPAARRLFVAIPEAFEAGQVVEQARAANPGLEIVARAHSDAEVEHLTALGADLAVMGEREIADRMLERALGRDGVPGNETGCGPAGSVGERDVARGTARSAE
jgi:CPA2 family monovalent cation:H+ antiporter-2